MGLISRVSSRTYRRRVMACTNDDIDEFEQQIAMQEAETAVAAVEVKKVDDKDGKNKPNYTGTKKNSPGLTPTATSTKSTNPQPTPLNSSKTGSTTKPTAPTPTHSRTS